MLSTIKKLKPFSVFYNNQRSSQLAKCQIHFHIKIIGEIGREIKTTYLQTNIAYLL